jgi:hypothetical protein
MQNGRFVSPDGRASWTNGFAGAHSRSGVPFAGVKSCGLLRHSPPPAENVAEESDSVGDCQKDSTRHRRPPCEAHKLLEEISEATIDGTRKEHMELPATRAADHR